MLDVRELLHEQEFVDASGQRVADAVYIVPSEVDKHHVLSPIFNAGAEDVGELFVFVW